MKITGQSFVNFFSGIGDSLINLGETIKKKCSTSGDPVQSSSTHQTTPLNVANRSTVAAQGKGNKNKDLQFISEWHGGELIEKGLPLDSLYLKSGANVKKLLNTLSLIDAKNPDNYKQEIEKFNEQINELDDKITELEGSYLELVEKFKGTKSQYFAPNKAREYIRQESEPLLKRKDELKSELHNCMTRQDLDKKVYISAQDELLKTISKARTDDQQLSFITNWHGGELINNGMLLESKYFQNRENIDHFVSLLNVIDNTEESNNKVKELQSKIQDLGMQKQKAFSEDHKLFDQLGSEMQGYQKRLDALRPDAKRCQAAQAELTAIIERSKVEDADFHTISYPDTDK